MSEISEHERRRIVKAWLHADGMVWLSELAYRVRGEKDDAAELYHWRYRYAKLSAVIHSRGIDAPSYMSMRVRDTLLRRNMGASYVLEKR